MFFTSAPAEPARPCWCLPTSYLDSLLSGLSLDRLTVWIASYWCTVNFTSPNSSLCQWFAAPVTQWHVSLFLLPKWLINTSINNSNGTARPCWQPDDGGEDEHGYEVFKACQQLSLGTLSILFLLRFLSLSPLPLINTQGSSSDIHWPAWVSLMVNNKLFGLPESKFSLTAALFCQWPHYGIRKELWRCGQNANIHNNILVV